MISDERTKEEEQRPCQCLSLDFNTALKGSNSSHEPMTHLIHGQNKLFCAAGAIKVDQWYVPIDLTPGSRCEINDQVWTGL